MDYQNKYYKYKAKYFFLKAGEEEEEEPNEENLGDDFYPRLNSETNPYIYLIGGGNEIKTGHRYANLQDESGYHPFINDFIEGPQSFTTRELEEAIELFKRYPDKDEFGVSLSICFINQDTGNVDSAYCLLAYHNRLCSSYHSRRRPGLPLSFENDILVVKNRVDVDVQPLPEDLSVVVPEFLIG